MLIAHGPAGYVIGSAIAMLSRSEKSLKGKIVSFSVVGALAPDLDLFYQFFVDNNRVGHHNYITHTPAFWVACFVASIPVVFFGKKAWLPALGFFLGTFSHIILDTPMGGIMWMYPISDSLHYCIEVETVLNPHKHFNFYGFQIKGWMLNMINHWSFSYETVIVKVAALVWSIKILTNLLSKIHVKTIISRHIRLSDNAQ